MSENYRTCLCGKKVHVKQGPTCPHCGLTEEQHQANQLFAENRIKQKQQDAASRNQKEHERKIAASFYCKECGTCMPRPKMETKGYFLLELFLWLCFLLPGVLYSLWRLTSKAQVCTLCGSKQIIPANSPFAVKALKQR